MLRFAAIWKSISRPLLSLPIHACAWLFSPSGYRFSPSPLPMTVAITSRKSICDTSAFLSLALFILAGQCTMNGTLVPASKQLFGGDYHSCVACRYISPPLASRIFARQQRVTRGYACGGYRVGVGESQSICGKRVHVGRGDILCSVARKVAVSQVVGIYEHYVGALGSLLSLRCFRGGKMCCKGGLQAWAAGILSCGFSLLCATIVVLLQYSLKLLIYARGHAKRKYCCRY